MANEIVLTEEEELFGSKTNTSEDVKKVAAYLTRQSDRMNKELEEYGLPLRAHGVVYRCRTSHDGRVTEWVELIVGKEDEG